MHLSYFALFFAFSTQLVCFGRSFILKDTTETAVTAVAALCFSHCHKKRFKGGARILFL